MGGPSDVRFPMQIWTTPPPCLPPSNLLAVAVAVVANAVVVEIASPKVSGIGRKAFVI